MQTAQSLNAYIVVYDLSKMRYFDSGTSLKTDECSKTTTNSENGKIIDYQTFNYNTLGKDCAEMVSDIQNISLGHPNLRFKIGYGHPDECHSDVRSGLQRSELTHGSEKIQLATRNFIANPDLSSGVLIPHIESQLQQGYSSTFSKDCDKMAEVDFNRFIPFDPCLKSFYDNYHASISDVHSIGENSRDIVQSKEFVKKCNFI